jgi:preprotein translocase subunit SecG
MYTLLIILSSVLAVLLILIVLLQSSKGGGLAGTFGGAGGMGTMFGTRRTADFLSKGTWWIAGALVLLAVIVNLFFLPGATTSTQRESIIQGNQRTVPTPNVPQQQAPQQQPPQQ